LIAQLISEVGTHRGGRRSLSPNWKVPADAIKAPTRLIPPWLWISSLASVLIMIVLFLIFRFWLSSTASEAVSRMAL
jgi:type VI protein secretion system component VasF